MGLKLDDTSETLRLLNLKTNEFMMMEEMAQKLAELEKQNGRK